MILVVRFVFFGVPISGRVLARLLVLPIFILHVLSPSRLFSLLIFIFSFSILSLFCLLVSFWALGLAWRKCIGKRETSGVLGFKLWTYGRASAGWCTRSLCLSLGLSFSQFPVSFLTTCLFSQFYIPLNSVLPL